MLTLLRRFKRIKNEIEEGVAKSTKLLEIDRKYQIFEWYKTGQKGRSGKRDRSKSPFVLKEHKSDIKEYEDFGLKGSQYDSQFGEENEEEKGVFLKHETTSKFKPLSDILTRNWKPEVNGLNKNTKSLLLKKNYNEKIFKIKKKFIRLYQETVMKIPIESEIRASGKKILFLIIIVEEIWELIISKKLPENKWIELINAFINERLGIKKMLKMRKLQLAKKKGLKQPPRKFRNINENSDVYRRAVIQSKEGDKENAKPHNSAFNQSFGVQKQGRNYYKTHCVIEEEGNF